MRKLWGGAFSGGSDALADRFGRSLEDDLRFWREDVEGSIAHARMLGSCGIVKPEEAARITSGLEQILSEGPERLPSDVEDIHTAVEVRLGEIIGPVAGKLHTARSRNDQVATDARRHLRRRCEALGLAIKALQGELLQQAKGHSRTLMPGVTHQQHAQPISLAFHLLAHFWPLQRAGWRLEALREELSWCPLGSAALAGSSFPIDRRQTAAELGFRGPCPSALDATSDRSWALDGLHLTAVLMIDLSRMCQEIVNWTGPEYGFLRLDDAVTTGSSIMPQKRNPDMAELIRGRAGQALGAYVALATTLKGLVLGYNRDTQDDKPGLFASYDLAEDSLMLCATMLAGARWDTRRMRAALRGDFSTATELADALAREGMPFREAHGVVGRVVRGCAEHGWPLDALSEAQWATVAPELRPDLRDCLRPEAALAAKESEGGTGPKAVQAQWRRARGLWIRNGFKELA